MATAQPKGNNGSAIGTTAAHDQADTYAARGVSSDKEDVHKAIEKVDKGLFPSAFCKVIPDHLAGSEEHCMVQHADGAGTKSLLAYLAYKQTGDLSVFRGISQDAIVMNLDDVMCAGATGPFTYSSTIGRNKALISGEILAELVNGAEAFCAKMRDLGIELHTTGGETADLGDIVRTLVVDGTLVARMKRERVVSANLRPGNIIVGFASFGKATYEDEPNSGIGSNGLTDARHDLLSPKFPKDYDDIYAPQTESNMRYTGLYDFKSEIKVQGKEHSLRHMLLSPTRTYAPIIKKVLDSPLRDEITGIIHCSGGGQKKVLNFVNIGNMRIVKDDMFEIPPVFRLIQRESRASDEHMLRTYNMGHRLEMYLKSEDAAANAVIEASQFGVEAKIIGRCEELPTGSGPEVVITLPGRETVRFAKR